MVLPNDVFLSKNLMTKVFGQNLVDEIIDFSNTLNSLQLTYAEHSLLFPVIFTNRGMGFNLFFFNLIILSIFKISTLLIKKK